MNIGLYGDILVISSPLVLIIGILIGTYYFRYIKGKLLFILLYLMACLFFDFLSRYLGSIQGNNLSLWPLYSLSELIIFSAFYFNFIKKKKAIMLFIITGIGYMIFEFVYIDVYNVKAFQSYAKIVTSFLIVITVLSNIIWQVSTNQNIAKDDQRLNNMVLVNFALSLLLLLPINLLINKHSQIITFIWLIYLLITVLFYIYLSFVLWKNGKNQKQLYSGS